MKLLAPKISQAIKKYKKGPLHSDIMDAPKVDQAKEFQELLKTILKEKTQKK